MRAEFEQAFSEWREAACFQRAEAAEQVAAGGECALWWGIEKAQFVTAPGGQFQRQAGKFSEGDFRAARGFQTLRLRP